MRELNSSLTQRSWRQRGGLWLAFALTGAAALGTVGLAHPARAAGQNDTGMEIYRGDSNQASGLILSSWGSGSIVTDDRTAYGPNQSLRISTQGYYQGASIGFKTPFDLGPFLNNKNALLQFALLLPASTTGQPGGFPGFPGGFPGGRGGFPGGPGGFPGASGGFPGGQGAPPGFPGGFPGRGGFPGMSGRGGQMQTRALPLQNLRMVMVTAGGKQLEMRLPLSYARVDNQWRLLSIPVPAVPGLAADDSRIKEVRLFGDAPATIYLGKIGVVIDMTPLTIDRIDEQVVGTREARIYTARASAGATPLKFSWDWDASDGIQDESDGRSVRHAYYKTGDYTVTITVSDAFNVKQPVTTHFKVHVHQ